MRCERAQELYSEYCEGTIPNALRVSMDSHITACAGCREAVEDLRFVWRALQAAPSVDPPAGFRASVLQRLEAQGTRREESGWLQRFLTGIRQAPRRQVVAWGAAALTLVVLAGITVPGSRSTAWFGMGYRGDARSQFIAAKPRVESQNGQTVLAIPLQIANADGKLYDGPDIRVRVRALGLGNTESTALISGSTAGIVRIPLGSVSHGGPITLEVTRTDGGEPASQILTVPVPRP